MNYFLTCVVNSTSIHCQCYTYLCCDCIPECVPSCRGYILDMMEGGRKLIVFGHHRVVLDAICESLEDKVEPTYSVKLHPKMKNMYFRNFNFFCLQCNMCHMHTI